MVINCHKNNVLKQSLPQFKMSDDSLVMYIFLPRSVHAFVAEKGFVYPVDDDDDDDGYDNCITKLP